MHCRKKKFYSQLACFFYSFQFSHNRTQVSVGQAVLGTLTFNHQNLDKFRPQGLNLTQSL